MTQNKKNFIHTDVIIQNFAQSRTVFVHFEQTSTVTNSHCDVK